MIKRNSFIFGLGSLLCSGTALAGVDITEREQVKVGTWDELKNAVLDGSNTGKAIVLINDIVLTDSDKDENGIIQSLQGSFASDIIIDGGGHSIVGIEQKNSLSFLSLYYNKTDTIIQNLNVKNFDQAAYFSYGSFGTLDVDFNGNHSVVGGKVAAVNAWSSEIKNILGKFVQNSIEKEAGFPQGGAIYNDFYSLGGTIENINAEFSGNYVLSDQGKAAGGAIYNAGSIGQISGLFSDNHAQGAQEASGGAIYNSINGWGNNTIIENINAEFSGNYALSDQGKAAGGAIYNEMPIGEVSGLFSANYAQGAQEASGGAIYNSNTSGNIIADFSGTHADSSIVAKGGAIYNDGEMTLLNSSFYNNYVQTDSLKNSVDGQKTQGGAIYSTNNLTIKADGGDSIFSGNKVKWADGEDSSAIYMAGFDNNNLVLTLDAQNNGLIQFDDKIAAAEGNLNDILSNKFNNANIIDDGEGGYIIGQNGEIRHYKKYNDMYIYSENKSTESLTTNVTQAEVEQFINDIKSQQYDITKEGDNYIISGFQDGMLVMMEMIKQENGNYTVGTTYSWTEEDSFTNLIAVMNITGDKTSHVEFNNAIEKVARINISGTNVDVNKGAGTIYRTVTSNSGVLNINAEAKAEDSIVDNGGVMNVANAAEISRTEINQGGVLNVAAGGYAEDTTVNSGGQLNAKTQARLNNLLANGGAILDIDSGAVLTGNIVMHADAQMGGTYDYSKIFKDDVTDEGSLTLIGGLNDVMTETSLVNNTEGKNLHLTAGNYVIGTNAQAVLGWDLLALRDNATVKINGDIALSDAKDKILIEQNSILDLAGNSPSDYKIVGSVSNDGDMTFTHSGDDADDITTIFGNYTAYNNATMTMDVNPSNNTSDLLRIEGDVSGTTKVDLNIVGASSDKPSQLIPFVEAPNDLDSTGAYFVINRVYNSAYVWKSLYKDGVWYTGTEDMILAGDNGYGNGDNGDLDEDAIAAEEVLPPNMADIPSITLPNSGEDTKRSPSVVAEAIAYMGLPSVGIEQTRDMTRNVANKVAATKTYSQECHGFYDCAYDGKALRNAWAAPVYSYSDVKKPYSYEAEISGFEGGFDIQSDVYNRLGVFVSYRQGNYDFDGDGEDYYSRTGSEIDIDSYILGLYHRYDQGKAWTFAQMFLGYQDVSMTTDDGVSSDTDGVEFGASIEGGLIFNPMTNLTIEPIIRLAYTQINYDDASDRYGKVARYGDVRNVEIEAGVKVEKTYLRKNGYAKVYVKPSIIQNIGSGDVTVTSLRQVDGLENATLGRIEVGGSMSFDEQWSGYANAAYTFGSDYNSASVNAGLNYAF